MQHHNSKVIPLLRKTNQGWEALRIGTLAQGAPRYEALEWDERAWECRQEQARQARRAHQEEIVYDLAS